LSEKKKNCTGKRNEATNKIAKKTIKNVIKSNRRVRGAVRDAQN